MNNDKTTEVYFKPPAEILVIDDSHLNRSFIVNAFIAPNYNVVSAVDAREGIAMAKAEKPELILLDIMMPGMDGFEAAEILKGDPDTADIPIIFITALDAIQDKLKAFEAGAVDFVTKPFNHKELIARVRTNVELRRKTEENEEMYRIVMEEKRNAAIARIAAGVSHNFNNMLGVSFGNIMLVESVLGQDINPMAKDALGDVKKSLERMQALVKQFLLLANRSSEVKGGKPHPSNIILTELVDDVISNLTFQKTDAVPPIEVNCENNVNPGDTVFCDSGHLREIFQLILNEVIETTLGKAKCNVLSLDTEDSELNRCVIQVAGIPHQNENVDAIFEPFALPIANVGAGLSFSVAKYLVELNGGTITAGFPSEEEIDFMITFNKPRA